jgi:hypothetical protein
LCKVKTGLYIWHIYLYIYISIFNIDNTCPAYTLHKCVMNICWIKYLSLDWIWPLLSFDFEWRKFYSELHVLFQPIFLQRLLESKHLKIKVIYRGCECSSVTEHLRSTCKALGSIPQYKKKANKVIGRKRIWLIRLFNPLGLFFFQICCKTYIIHSFLLLLVD